MRRAERVTSTTTDSALPNCLQVTSEVLPALMHTLLGVKRFGFRSRIRWHRGRFDRAHAAQFESEPTMMKQRIRISGESWLEELGPKSCKACYRVELEVRMAGVASMLEDALEKRVRDSYTTLNRLTMSYMETESYRAFVRLQASVVVVVWWWCGGGVVVWWCGGVVVW
jgi:hypothetical protein